MLPNSVRFLTLLTFAPSIALGQGAGYWHTNGNQLLDSSNQPVRIAGVNWYGFEGTPERPQGLWAQDYKTILNAVKSNGYNTIRVPLSDQTVEHPVVPNDINFSNGMNADLAGLNSLQILDKVVAYAGQLGLKVILDNHRSDAGSGTETGLWYTATYPESSWISDWQALATRYAGNPTIIGMDLRNEPHDANAGGACWDCGTTANDWHLAAERGGNAILAINPSLLIFVEGTDCYGSDCTWWGGMLEGVAKSPVVLNVANRVVYSAHDYGPNLYQQSWFNSSTTPASLDALWTKWWAYISQQNIAPVWIGEFGTTNNNTDIENSAAGSQGQWFQSVVGFMSANGALNWTYWALDGEDSYGLLDANYDPTPANPLKQQLLASIQSPLSGGGGNPNPPASPTNLSASAVSSSQINLTWTTSSTAGVTYSVYSSTTSGFSTSPATLIASGVTATTFSQTGLNPSTTYYYLVTAVNSSGESTPSNGANATTKAGSTGGNSCQVGYSIVTQWNNGFTAAITIQNTGSTAINGWNLSWTWPGNQQITQSWNGNYTQSGASANIVNASWNGSIPAGGTAGGIGFNANFSGSNPAPTAFSLNGAPCSGSAGSDSSGPAAPSNLTASAISSSQINLSWTASTTSGVTYNVYSGTTRIATGLTGATYQNTGLAASTTYSYTVTAVNSSGESAASNSASATTQSAPPPPPAAPTGLSATAVSSSQINLSWTASTTSGVTYNVYSGSARIAANVASTTYQNTGLTPSTPYTYTVTAMNAGGESSHSNQASATTQAATGGLGGCHITYVDQNDWSNGFTANLSITNNGSTPINGWTVQWTWSGNQQLSGGAWNANSTQNGQNVTLTNQSYNAGIAAGATLTGIGFNANYSGSNTAPTVFVLNGTRCQ
ncbi:MAG TPA: cellulose binding domain-containing protein [Bryobacteraceae bacterium]|jgi:endoglucanase